MSALLQIYISMGANTSTGAVSNTISRASVLLVDIPYTRGGTCCYVVLDPQYHVLRSGLSPFLGKHLVCILSTTSIYSNLHSWPDTSDQLLRYVADRTGILSFANFPLIWLFAGRNNIFLWATGWSFASFNIVHRHIAWIATIQGLVHTALYLVMFIQSRLPLTIVTGMFADYV